MSENKAVVVIVIFIAGPREARNPNLDCVLRVRAMFITGMLKPEIQILFCDRPFSLVHFVFPIQIT